MLICFLGGCSLTLTVIKGQTLETATGILPKRENKALKISTFAVFLFCIRKYSGEAEDTILAQQQVQESFLLFLIYNLVLMCPDCFPREGNPTGTSLPFKQFGFLLVKLC